MQELVLPCNDRRSKSRRALAHLFGHEFNHLRKPFPPEPSPHPSPNPHLQHSHPHQELTMSASFPQTNHNPLAKVTFTHPRTFPPSTVCRCPFPFPFKSACATFLTCPPTHSGLTEGVQMTPCRKALRESYTLLALTRPRTRLDISRHPCPAVTSSRQPAHLPATMSVEVNSQTFSVTHAALWSRTHELTSLSLFFKEARPQQLAKNHHRSAVSSQRDPVQQTVFWRACRGP